MYRHTSLRLIVLICTVTALLSTSASMAMAQPPSNDDYADVVAIGQLPFTDTLDTTEATTASDDPDCSGNGPTVWYSFTTSESVSLRLDTFGSDYDTTLSAYTGVRGDLEQIACNDDTNSAQSRIFIEADAGVTYWFMVGACCGDPDAAGGNLVLNAAEGSPPPPPTMSFTIDPIGSVDPSTGLVSIRGTATCSNVDWLDLWVSLEQRSGRTIIRGDGGTFVPCDGTVSWTVEVSGYNGLFTSGRADVSVNTFACGFEGCVDGFEDRSVRLRGKRK